MTPSPEQKLAGLSKLTIDREQRPDSSRRGWLGLAGLILGLTTLAGGAIAWYYQTTGKNIAAAFAEPPREVVLVRVTAPGANGGAPVLVANGKIVSDRKVNVATKVSGQIVELNVEQGDTVVEGGVLARVEDLTYRAQRDEVAANVARSEYALQRAQAQHARAVAAAKQAQAEAAFADYNFHRLQRLEKSNETSEVEVVEAKNRFDATAAAWEAAKADAQATATAIDLAQAELDAAQAILRLAQKRLDDCAIRAPIAGVILERNAQVGDFLAAEGGRGANANAQLVSIADMTRLRVEIDVSERDIHRVSARQPARITPDALRSKVYRGEVMWIDPIGDYARATVQVKVRICDPGPELRVEGSAKVEFLSPPSETSAPSAASGAIWIPKSAVQLVPGSDDGTVFTVADGRATSHGVKLGARSEKDIEVRSGVTNGMEIIVGSLDEMRDGAAVRVMRTVSRDDL